MAAPLTPADEQHLSGVLHIATGILERANAAASAEDWREVKRVLLGLRNLAVEVVR